MRLTLFTLLLTCLAFSGNAKQVFLVSGDSIVLTQPEDIKLVNTKLSLRKIVVVDGDTVYRPKKGVAIALAVLLGPFGMHRLYLGTKPRVPIFYTLTLGGGLGILPLIDIIMIAIRGDWDKFYNNSKFIMWTD